MSLVRHSVTGQSIPDPRSRNVEGPTTDCRQSEHRHHQATGAGGAECPPTVQICYSVEWSKVPWCHYSFNRTPSYKAIISANNGHSKENDGLPMSSAPPIRLRLTTLCKWFWLTACLTDWLIQYNTTTPPAAHGSPPRFREPAVIRFKFNSSPAVLA